jgi:uncharacterized protein
MRPLFSALLTLVVTAAYTQKIARPQNLAMNDEALAAVMPKLAAEVAEKYSAKPGQAYWDNLFRINFVAQRYSQAVVALDSLHQVMKNDTWEGTPAVGIQFRAYALAQLGRAATGKDFATVFTDTLAALYYKLPDKAKPVASGYFLADTASFRITLKNQLNRLAAQDSMSIDQARMLVRAYSAYYLMQQVMRLGNSFLRAEEHKNFVIQDSLLVPGAGNAQLTAVIFRKRDATSPLPVVMLYNIYARPSDRTDARMAAEKGYAGVVINTRGKNLSPQEVEPFEHDAVDAYAVIDWISKQPWCNGKIGMYGGSYLGFSQWSAVKKLHPALKTIVPQVAVGPGIDYPMHNGVFMPYMLQWIHYVANNKLIDRAEFIDGARWDSLYFNWYRSGRSFRSLDTMDGRPNKLFQRWLDHPTHDKFWQSMVPYKKDFAAINIPVLTTTGYFDADQRGAFYYYNEHHRWNKNAQHYLLIGPYDHGGAQSAAAPQYLGYVIDSVANININETVWQWFDHHLRGGAFPSRLKDKVNYQVMGANLWRSAPNLQSLASDSLILYLGNAYTKDGFKLEKQLPKLQEYITHETSYTDRTALPDATGPALDSNLIVGESLKFISEPLQADMVMTGSLEGELKLVVNKKDVDLALDLYELQPDGKYFRLSNTLQRASFVKDPTRRTLLRPGVEETLPVYNSFFTSKKLSKGSRLVLVAGMNKSPHWQVNYGTGKDVSLETMEDGKVPLQIKWSNRSYIKVPLSKL